MDKKQEAYAAAEEIRSASRAGKLTSSEDLFPAADSGEEADPNREEILTLLKEDEALIALGVVLDKSGREWYYSRTEMMPGYAQTLVRVQDEDLLTLIADTVRGESKTYPRATRLDLFRGAPFQLTEEALEAVCRALKETEETADIQETEASNGTRFLFSSRHLTPFYARKLAEWEEVESKEIP